MRKLIVGLALLAVLLLVAFLVLRTPDVPADEARARYANAESEFAQVLPGLTLHYRDEGPKEAPAIVLIHGSNASLHTWEPWARLLKSGYRVVTLDMQGHGLTGEHPTRCYSQACMVETVEALRQHLGLDRIAIGGNSMGGAIAWAYAMAHPDRTAALILVDAAGAQVPPAGAEDAEDGGKRPPPIGFRIARTPVIRNLAEHITPRAMIERSLDASVSVKSVASPRDVDRYWELLRYPGNRRATLDRFGTPRQPVDKADFAKLSTIPTLIIWGEEDRLFPPSHAIWFQAALPHARKVIYPGIGHLPQEEAPERSAADVLDFLAPVWPAHAEVDALEAAA